MRLTIKTDNAAFTDNPREEVARILRDAAAKVSLGYPLPMNLFDINGNKVGIISGNLYKKVRS